MLSAKSGLTCGGVQIFDLANDTHLQRSEATILPRLSTSQVLLGNIKLNLRLKPPFIKRRLHLLFRQRPTLPGGLPPSTISAEELNFRVRNGNGWILFAIITGYFLPDCQLNNAKNLVSPYSFSSFCY